MCTIVTDTVPNAGRELNQRLFYCCLAYWREIVETGNALEGETDTYQVGCKVGILRIPLHACIGFVPLNAGYTVSVRRTRLNVLVLLTLALAGESPTCILHEGIHTP